MRIFKRINMLVAALGVVLYASVASADAQATKTRPKPLATPPPVLTGAEIISRAGEEAEIVPVIKVVETPAEMPKSSNSAKINDLSERIKKLESGQRSTYDEKQKRLLLNLDILTRTEQLTESLRKQLFEMIEKESAVKARLDQIEFEARPEIIERSLQLGGSFRPEEIRENRRRSLAAEKTNIQSLLGEIQATRATLTGKLQKAESMADRVRGKLEKDIDDSFLVEDEQN